MHVATCTSVQYSDCCLGVLQVRFKRFMVVDYGWVTLWKNELLELGEHAHYAIVDSITCFQPGLKYTFDWS